IHKAGTVYAVGAIQRALAGRATIVVRSTGVGGTAVGATAGAVVGGVVGINHTGAGGELDVATATAAHQSSGENGKCEQFLFHGITPGLNKGVEPATHSLG